jgi:hypothetical protein
MAKSVCVKCGGDTFVIEQTTMGGSVKSIAYFIQCTKCEDVVGLVFDNIAETAKQVNGLQPKNY